MKPTLQTFLTFMLALTATACTSLQTLHSPEQVSATGIDAGDKIILNMLDGRQIKARFVKIEAEELVYDTRSGGTASAPLSAIDSISYRAFDGDKTNSTASTTVAVIGAAYLGALIAFLIMMDAEVAF